MTGILVDKPGRTLPWCAAFMATTMMLGLSGTAHAQAQSDATAYDGEIVITANKLGTDVSRAPMSLTTISSEEITENRIQALQDIQSRTTSLVFDTSSAFAQPFIRGMGSAFSLAGLETAVATYVDGVYLQRQAGANLDLVDLKSVQVLKGPQGTLYGRNATGGAILLETADPTQHLAGMASAEYGRFDHIRLQAMLNLPVSETFALRFAGQYQENGSFLKDVYDGGKRGAGNKRYLRMKALWTPTPEFSVNYMLEYSRTRSTAYSQRAVLPAPFCVGCAIYGVTPPTGFYESGQSDNAFFKVRYLAHTLKLSYDADNLTIDSITGYRDQTVDYINDQDFVGPNFFDAKVRETGPTFTNDTYLRTRSQGPLNGLIGFSVERERNRQDASFLGDAFSPLVPFNRNRIAIDSYSIYGEATYAIMPELRVTAGARYNHDRKRIRVSNNADAVIALGTIPDFVAKASFDNVTPRVLLSYQPGDDVFYASYNRGARSGGFGSPIITPDNPVNPETLDNFEIGAKNRFLDGRLRTSVALFYGIYRDIQIQLVDASSGTVLLQNAAKGKVSGLEFDMDLEVARGFNIHAGATHLINKFKDYKNAAIFEPVFDGAGNPLGLAGGVADLSGTRLPRSPRWSGYFAADYQTEIGNDWSIRIAGTVRATSSYLFSAGAGGPLGIDRTDGYTTVDGTFDVISPGEHTTIGIYGQNLFGKHYITQALTAAFGAFVSPSMPLSYGVRAIHKF